MIENNEMQQLTKVACIGITLAGALSQPVLADSPSPAVSSAKISSAVKWTRQSVEYPLLTAAIYQQASAQLRQQVSQLPERSPWLVIMDVDETVLDNSAYNLSREQLNSGFSGDSWQQWVQSQQATAVPGAFAFMQEVYRLGGQIALVTNRNRDVDGDTWQNIAKLGLPLTRQNTCILGRTAADKKAVGQPNIINDKDLRRQQLQAGQAQDCWQAYSDAKQSWQRPLTLVMQVGDNIMDFAGLTQQSAQQQQATLLPQLGHSLILLPNAMYGSWDH